MVRPSLLRRYYLSLLRPYSTGVQQRLPSSSVGLSSSIFDIATEVPKPTRTAQKHVTNFYQGLKTQDLELASKTLTEISQDVLRAHDERAHNTSVEFYFDCFKILLDSFANTTPSKSLNLLRRNVEEYNSMVEKLGEVQDQEEIETDILKAILRLYAVSKRPDTSSVFAIPIMEYFTRVLDSLNVSLHNLAGRLDDEELQSALTEICQAKKLDLVQVSQQPQESYEVPIQPYLNKYGGIEYERLCKYISDNKFKWKGEEINSKMFQFYDRLPELEKSQFMSDYLAFNKVKELAVETYASHSVYIPRRASQEFQTLLRFGNAEKDLLSQWVKSVSQEVERAMTVQTPKSELEKTLRYFRPFLQTVTVESIVSYMIQILLSSSEYNGVSVVLSRMRYSYSNLLSQQSLPSAKSKIIYKYITDDLYDKLSEGFIEVIADTCKLTISEQEIADMQSSLKLRNQSVAEEFLTRGPDDTYKAFCFGKELATSNSHLRHVIRLHPHLALKLEAATLTARPKYLPLLHPPKPWTSPSSGGYLNYQTEFVSTTDTLHKQLIENAGVAGHLDSAYHCLNEIGNTAWTINPQMLDVFNEVIQYPEGFLSIPAVKQDPSLSPRERKELADLRSAAEMNNMVANAFGKNGDVLYHCYMIDFRGRVYTYSSLTHYASDLTRSLFLFWESKPLGPNGFYWVKYQLASLFGGNDCEEFYNENLDSILDSATDPLGGSRWWMKADKPFGALSVCFEIKNILDFEAAGNRIEDYLCRLPIHQDGSCNGLQHYAALAADESGGRAVNLVQVGDSKQDVYVQVMEKVRSKIEEDIKDPTQTERAHSLAQFFLKILSRKLVKRPVMTTVYGVTLSGASAQIKSTIKEILEDHRTNPQKAVYDQQTLERLSALSLSDTTYLAKKVLDSISELFAHAKQIEEWLLQNTRRMLTSYSVHLLDYLEANNPKLYETIYTRPVSFSPISWLAPSGFPVIQVYRDYPTKALSVGIGTIKSVDWTKITPMNRAKHAFAIAPNFIHSLDASHMFITCAAARKQGITFCSVHDSFWTHPNDVPTLASTLRRTFVDMHSSDYLERVKEDFVAQTKRSYQLVEFESKAYPELARKIKEVRAGYTETRKVHVLSHELRQMAEQGEEHIMRKLYHEYKPKVYQKVSNKRYEYSTSLSPVIPKLEGRKVAMFVPVEILDVPARGQLDITKVLDSKYFFS